MKTILITFVCILSTFWGQAQQASFHITGTIQGDCNGMTFKLQDSNYPPQTLATTVIKDHKFELSGHVPAPGMYCWIIDQTPQGKKSSEENWLSGTFYLENSEISFEGDINTLPAYYWNPARNREAIIKGSATEDAYQTFRSSTLDLRKARGKADEAYLEKYHRPAMKGVFNTAEGVRLAREISKLDQQINEVTLQFIQENPSSVVAFDQASYYMEDQINLTATQIDEIVNALASVWGDRPEMTAFREKAAKAKKIALGTHYQDIELIDPTGKKVKLSDYIPSGKYVMLEFWASWCGPCRGEIPHLKHIYQDYKNKGFEIVSVSVDERDKDWQKAMKEEKMPWIQLNDRQGKNGPAVQVYNVLGVPYCILLDKEGKIMKTNMRGAYLDATLEQLIP